MQTLTRFSETSELRRRLRNLTVRGLDPLDALRLASRLDVPLL